MTLVRRNAVKVGRKLPETSKELKLKECYELY